MAAGRLRARPDPDRDGRPGGPGVRRAPRRAPHGRAVAGQHPGGPDRPEGAGRPDARVDRRPGVRPGLGGDPGARMGGRPRAVRSRVGDGLPPADRGRDPLRHGGCAGSAVGHPPVGARAGAVPGGGVPWVRVRDARRVVPGGDGGRDRRRVRDVRGFAPPGSRARQRADGDGGGGRQARGGGRPARGPGATRPVGVPHGHPRRGRRRGSRRGDPGHRRGGGTRAGMPRARRAAAGNRRGRRGTAGVGRGLRRSRLRPGHAVRRRHRAVRRRPRLLPAEPARGSGGGRGAPAGGRHGDRDPAREGGDARIDRSRPTPPARQARRPGLAGDPGRAAAFAAGRDAGCVCESSTS